jgi:hypothetical protein
MYCSTPMTALWLAAACSSTAVAQDRKDYPPCEAYQSIGAAHMDADGVITLYIHTLAQPERVSFTTRQPIRVTRRSSHTWASSSQ